MRWFWMASILALATSPISPARAQSPAPADSTELARRIDALARQIADLQLGPVAAAPESRHGFGPAASKVYAAGAGVSIGGYGEMLASGEAQGGERTIDFVRQIVYVGYKFDDHLLFNSEIEFEHASTELNGSVSTEFAYLDALLRPELNLRAGLVLVPMGFVNELHEPPVFLGARRPETELRIIPTTWRANGAGVFGDPAPGWSYRAYVMESLRSAGGTGENAGFDAAGLRDGRQNGSEAQFEDVAGVLRAGYEARGLSAGGAVFYGPTAQGARTPGGQDLDATTTIWEGHAQLRRSGLRLRGLVAGAHVDEAAGLNAIRGFTGNESIGSSLLGWYVEAGYELWSRLQPESRFELVPYVRYEALDSQRTVPAGFARDPANDRSVLTAGAAFYPHAQVVVKADYEWNSNAADTGVDRWNAAIGFLF